MSPKKRQRGFLLAPYRFSTGPAGDPHWANVVSLLHFDGTDGGTTFIDETGKTWTPAGNVQIDTAQSKFGGASGLFDGNGDWLYHGASTDFDFGTGDFTIECWLRRNSYSDNFQGIFASDGASYGVDANTILAFGNSTGVNVSQRQRVGFGGYNLDTAAATLLTAQLSLGVWYHVAATRSGNTFRLFLDGVLQGSSTYSGSMNFNGGGGTRIGSNRWDGSTGEYHGWIDELRITKGVARYTANFTAPDAAFPNF